MSNTWSPFLYLNMLNEYQQLKTIQKLAEKRNVHVYLVGGFLRDLFLTNGKNIKMDFDFAVSKNAIAFARQFANQIKGAFVLLDEEHGCARVAKKSAGYVFTFDFADFRSKTFKGDLAHRDFTINTLALDVARLKEGQDVKKILFKNEKAFSDIKKKSIRMTSSTVFKEDPLRIMRAFALMATLGFNIAKPTLNQIKKDKKLILNVSFERVRDELFKILSSERTFDVMRLMDQLGVLECVIPQIRVMYDCTQGGYHHLDVWPHSLEALRQLDEVLKEQEQNPDVRDYLKTPLTADHSRKSVLKLATLLHDIGKPETKKKEEDRFTFHGHEHVGKHIVRHVARMLKLSKTERHSLEDMVRWHLRPGYLSDFKNPSERAVFRYFRDTKDDAVNILLLSMADQRATRGPMTSESDQAQHRRICLKLIDQYFMKKKEKPFVALITGHDLIKKLKLKPSPLFGKILKEVEEKQVLGKITTKHEALETARTLATKG
jgi:poly(A) polymerase